MIEYFQHDYHARNDPKLLKIEVKLGRAARMTYWDLVEMLYENDGKLLISECDLYAFALRAQCELLHELIYDFDVFQVSECGTFFYSNGVNKRLELRGEKSKKAQKSANARWNKSLENNDSNANAMRTHSERNAIKEKKRKEKEIILKNNTLSNDVETSSEKVFISKFSPPELEDCKNYFVEKTAGNYTTEYAKKEAECFWYFYESKNWMVGKNKMKEWQKAAGGWLARKSRETTTNNLKTNNGLNNEEPKARIYTAQEQEQRAKLFAAGFKPSST